MKLLKSKVFLICLAVAAALALISVVFAVLGWTGPVGSVLRTVAKPFEWCGARIADAMNGFVDTFTEYDRLKEENQALRDELNSDRLDREELEQLRRENQWLKDFLDLSSEHPDFRMESASVIAREADNYSTVLTLNRGTVHGIKVNMPVLTPDGVFGYVKEVGLDWCRVVSIVETESSVGAYTKRGGVLGVVEGDADLRDGGTCLMRYVESSADLRIGDAVYTSGGPGSIYPEGLLIGEVISIDADEGTRTLIAGIQPAVDFSSTDGLRDVMILCGYDTEG